MLEKLKTLLDSFNKLGLPLPLIRDPKTGGGSVSLTLVFISSIYVQLALLNSIALIFKGVDVTNALYWHGICVSLYFGRTIRKEKDKVSIGGSEKNDTPSE